MLRTTYSIRLTASFLTAAAPTFAEARIEPDGGDVHLRRLAAAVEEIDDLDRDPDGSVKLPILSAEIADVLAIEARHQAGRLHEHNCHAAARGCDRLAGVLDAVAAILDDSPDAARPVLIEIADGSLVCEDCGADLTVTAQGEILAGGMVHVCSVAEAARLAEAEAQSAYRWAVDEYERLDGAPVRKWPVPLGVEALNYWTAEVTVAIAAHRASTSGGAA